MSKHDEMNGGRKTKCGMMLNYKCNTISTILRLQIHMRDCSVVDVVQWTVWSGLVCLLCGCAEERDGSGGN